VLRLIAELAETDLQPDIRGTGTWKEIDRQYVTAPA
jgi:hypothetical protein